jgi:hypothetical protein
MFPLFLGECIPNSLMLCCILYSNLTQLFRSELILGNLTLLSILLLMLLLLFLT